MSATAKDVMNPELTVVQPTDTIDTAIDLITRHRYRNLPVVDTDMRYLGTVSIHSLLTKILPRAALMARGLGEIPFMHETLEHLRGRLDSVRHKPVTLALCNDARLVAPDTPLLQTLLVLYRSRQSVAVVEPDTGKLLGMVSYFDVQAQLMGATARDPGDPA